MGGKAGLETGLALLLVAGMAWAGGAPGGEGNRGLSPIILDTQALVDYAQTLIEGEELMFVMDVPAIPAQETSIVLAQAATPSAGATRKPDFILQTCGETESTGDPRSAMRSVDPAYMLTNYLNRDKQVVFDLASIKNITLLQGTQHGNLLSSVSNTGRTTFHYDPTPDYVGNDRAVFMAEFEGKVYKIVVELHVFRGGVPGDFGASTCPDPQLIKVNKPRSDLHLDGASVTFADLPGSSLGQTTGTGPNTTITLDTNAAGHGWYIDYTPYLNEEYLPTSNPYEWIAKEGTAAYGKMDLLSVLLHEYGHALGIDHSADAHDLMAATLTPGMRRLPSADELALMARLVAEAKGSYDAPLPTDPASPDQPGAPLPNRSNVRTTRARITRNGTFVTGEDGVEREQPPQYEIAANPTLTDPKLQTGAGWETAGNVSIGNGAAILTESPTRQTRLNQVFLVGEHDRYLTFTVAGIALDDQASAPDDAFEAALLDANTGASLLGGTGLTRNDAFLNLQADGLERAGQNVTSTRNADGSRTYRIDLAGIPAGTAVNLSFDLIGFGPATSQITVRDIRLGVPETRDDTAVTLEDTPIDIAVTANDLDADQPGFAPVVVAGPAHGSVTLNAIGGFTYKLSDGAASTM